MKNKLVLFLLLLVTGIMAVSLAHSEFKVVESDKSGKMRAACPKGLQGLR